MTNAQLVQRKLSMLLDHVGRIEQRRPTSADALRKDLLVQDAIAMSLLVVVQEALDIALHIASDAGWEIANTYRDTFLVLAAHNVIDHDLALQLGQIAQLRNRIAHGYSTLDSERLFRELPNGCACMRTFAAAVARHLLQ